jgi:hypothetical protein
VASYSQVLADQHLAQSEYMVFCCPVKSSWPYADGGVFKGAVRFEPVFRFSGWKVDYCAHPKILWQIKLEGD